MHSLNVNSTALHLFIGRFSPLFLVFICYFDLANPHKPHKKLASKKERGRGNLVYTSLYALNTSQCIACFYLNYHMYYVHT